MSERSLPRILFYGSMVNLLYCAAKACNQSGLSVDYLIEGADTFPAHHPFWLDVFHQFTRRDSEAFYSDQEEFLREVNWIPPSFIRDEFSYKTNSFAPRTSWSPIKRYTYKKFYKIDRVQRLCNAFQEYDCIVVCGANAAIEAFLSGVPYVVFIYGADLRLYLGVDPPPKGILERASYEMYRQLLKDAYDNASAVVCNPPFSIYASGASNITKCKKVYRHNNVYELVYPVAAPGEGHHIDIELSNTKINILIPSRIDFYWKGQDLFLKALSESPYRDCFHVHLLQWGNHQQEAHQLVAELSLTDVVTFLPFFATRPLLLALYDKFDLIVDEFYIGTYGTAALEAMSRRKAVVTYIDKKMFSSEEHIPPCLSFCTKAEALVLFEKICLREVDLKQVGDALFEWQQQSGCETVFTENLLNILHDIGLEC